MENEQFDTQLGILYRAKLEIGIVGVFGLNENQERLDQLHMEERESPVNYSIDILNIVVNGGKFEDKKLSQNELLRIEEESHNKKKGKGTNKIEEEIKSEKNKYSQQLRQEFTKQSK